jgi:phage/plasmid-like protein (TIGR03299 family)
MAHEIMENDGLVLAGKKAWHGLGIVLPERCDVITALKTAKLEWQVEVCDINPTLADGTPANAGDYRAVIRQDTREMFCSCKSGYRPIQNTEIADLAYEISGFSDRAVETAGSLRNGRRVFFTLALDEIAAASDDIIKPYLFIAAGHDMSMRLTFATIATRVVCANTFAVGMEEGKENCLRIKHTQNAGERMAMVQEWLANPIGQLKNYEQQARMMAETAVSDDQLQAYFTSVWQRIHGKLQVTPKGTSRRERTYENEVGQWLRNFRNDPRQTGLSTGGTLWAAVNSVTQWANHERTVREEEMDPTRRVDSVLFGSGHRVNVAAHDAALALLA